MREVYEVIYYAPFFVLVNSPKVQSMPTKSSKISQSVGDVARNLERYGVGHMPMAKRDGQRLKGFLLLGLCLDSRMSLTRLTIAQRHSKEESRTVAGL